jgi:pimeloyl-ACP methyl ester carboxylesterase
MMVQAAWPFVYGGVARLKVLSASGGVEAVGRDLRQKEGNGLSKRVILIAIGAVAALGISAEILWPRPMARPDYVPHVSELRGSQFFVYPPRAAVRRGTILFFGNDVGFWQPHQQLADFLSSEGYAVVGFDLRTLLKTMPDAPESMRDSVIGGEISRVMWESLAEFRGGERPLFLMGHSLGAEVAIWTAAHVRVPVVTGVIAMAPGGRGHLKITAADFLSSALPSGPESFSMADLVKMLPGGLRVALVRGASDGYRGADPGIVAAGRGRVKEFPIPFAGHSLKRMLIARYVVENALRWSGSRATGIVSASN